MRMQTTMTSGRAKVNQPEDHSRQISQHQNIHYIFHVTLYETKSDCEAGMADESGALRGITFRPHDHQAKERDDSSFHLDTMLR